MTAMAWTVIGFAAAILLAAVGDLISEEIRGWLDLVPRAILRLAATQLDATQRETIYRDEWLPELIYALRGAESRPITRLIRGITFAVGFLVAARSIARSRDCIGQSPAVSTSEYKGIFSVTNGSGRAITIETLGLTLNNGNILELVPTLGKDIRSEVMAELQRKGLLPKPASP